MIFSSLKHTSGAILMFALYGTSLLYAQDVVNDVEQALINEQTHEQNITTELVPPVDDVEFINEIADKDANEIGTEEEQFVSVSGERIITSVTVSGNQFVPTAAILQRLPFRVGDVFDAQSTGRAIKQLYADLKRLRNITIMGKLEGDDGIALRIDIIEKKILTEVCFEGNKHLAEKDIRKKIDFSAVPAVDPEELERFAREIERLYVDKGYLGTTVEPECIIENNRARVIFHAKETGRSTVRRICFEGNNCFSSKELRNALYTREEWILSFMDGSGTYHPERIQGDKHALTEVYQNNGYINAKVVDILVDTCGNAVDLTFVVEEGDQFTISELSVDTAGVCNADAVLSMLPIQCGNLFSREKIKDSIKTIEWILGERGYIFAHVEPDYIPDEECKTVKLAFTIEPGEQVYLNKLTIKGHEKTRDKIIRRNMVVQEGELITNSAMEASRSRVEAMGYYDQKEDGVAWKITRLDEHTADLDLIVKEVKTGSVSAKLGMGGTPDQSSPAQGLTFDLNAQDTNFMGTGIKFSLTGKLAQQQQDIIFNITQPWLFDRPIYAAVDGYHRRTAYEDFSYADAMNEKRTNGTFTLGYLTHWSYPFFNDTFIRANIGGDSVRYERPPRVVIPPTIPEPTRTQVHDQYLNVLRKEFEDGTFLWLGFMAGKDTKSHPMHPNRGYTWLLGSQFAIPCISSNVGFYKIDLDANWWTPLIGERDLVLRLHGHAGFAKPFGSHVIPYRELYHTGGPTTVRGFLYGQIGPQFSTDRGVRSDSLGGSQTVYWNAELIFPITPDFNMKGVVFYDGGTSWDNPYAKRDFSPQNYADFVINDSFNYRHAVGVGFRMLSPMPVRVDWGFKIDPRKGEKASEVHFAMTYDW